MLQKLIIIYSVIVILNPANNLYTRATLNLNKQNDKGLLSSDNMETWQPIKTTMATTPSMSTTSTPTMKSSSSRINLTHKKPQQYLTAYQQTTDYIPYNHRSGNISKFNVTTSPLSVAASSGAYTNIKFKPSYLLMLNTNNNNNNNIQLRHNPTHHQHYLAKHTENVYPQIPKDIISQVQQQHTYMNTVTSPIPYNLHNRKADVNLQDVRQRQSTPQHIGNIIATTTTPTLDTWNVHANPIAPHISKDLNSFDTEKNLNDLNFPNEPAKKGRNSQRTEKEYDDVENNVVNLNEKLLLLQKTFNNVMEFYDNVKDIILSDKDNGDDDDTYSNEDETDDDNDLTMVNSAVGSDAAATATASATEKLSSLNMKKTIPLFSSLKGEVQGHKRQIDKGTTMKYSLISQQKQIQIQNVQAKAARPAAITARGLVWNMSKAKSSLAATPASLTTFGTGRKIKKKLKKKFQKFLFPLVLAYKLKFLTLIPLLIGGLTLLVGTTGLAGFFFALFTAVMSLKTGAKSAIVVKKYS